LGITVVGTGTNKIYDGTVLDAVTLASAGVVAGDTVNFADTSAIFANKNVANGQTVTISGITDSGSDAANYTLNNTTATTTANITPLGITVVGTGTNKIYDGTVLDAVTLASAGVVAGDTVNFADTSAVFVDKNVASGKTVTISGITDSGSDAGNYTLNNATASTTASITPLGITVVGTGTNKIYDGTVLDTVTLASAGVLAGDTVNFADTSAVFASKNAANGQTVTISGITDSGTDAGNYTLGSTSAITTADITPLGITVTGTAANKIYDGNTNAAVATLGSSGLISGDTVNFADTSAVFASKNVANGQTVTISGITDSGTDAGNYTLNNTTATTTANITPLGITVVGTGTNKIYDGTVLDTVILASAGVLSGDTVNFADTGAVFVSKNVANGQTVTISGITDSGTDAGNYTLNNTTATTTANITPLGITVVGTGINKIYDGTVLDTVTLASAGVVAGDTVIFADTSAVFAGKNVANGQTVTISGITDSGTDAGNYTLNNSTSTTTADITALGITVTGAAANKIYDGTAAATLSSFGSSGVLAGDTVLFADTGASFASKNVANGQTVTILGITDSGSDSGNYTLNNTTATTTANITPLGITVVGTGLNKIYDGTAFDTVTLASAGVVAGDSVNFADASAIFANKNVANGQTVTISGITDSGTDAGNYTLNNTTATTAANITPLSITVMGTGTNKIYDGNMLDTVMLASAGVVPGDTVSFADASADFANKSVANGQIVTISGITDSGADAANYTLNNASATTTANITPLGITVSGTVANKVYDGSTRATVASLTSSGVLLGDAVIFSDTGATFANRNVGNGKTVAISGITVAGADGEDYTVNSTAAAYAAITPLAITVSGTGTNKIYNGSVVDAVTLASLGVVAGDAITFDDVSATFANKNVGAGKTVSIFGITLQGPDAGNYALANSSVITTADITRATLTATAIPAIDGGGKLPHLTGSINGFVSGDTLANATTGTLVWTTNVPVNPHAGLYAIDGSGLSAQNYVIAQAPGNRDALSVTVDSTSLAQDDFGLLQPPLAADTIATPYGVGSSDDQANNTGNARSDSDPTKGNRYLTDFSGHLALVVIQGGVRLPQEAAN
jgi:hypothetical protein